MINSLITASYSKILTNIKRKGNIMHELSTGFVILVAVILSLKLYLNYRQRQAIVSNINQVPASFAQQIKITDHQKAAKYSLAKLRLNNFEEIFSSMLILIFTLGGGIQFINNQFSFMANSPLSQGVVVILAFSLINSILSIPIGIYSTFGIEQKFGFNNTSIKLYIADLLKGLILGGVIGIPLLYLVLWLMSILGNSWWLWVWLVLVAFNLTILIVYPIFIAPLFNKFSPLEDVVLKNRIGRLLEKCGFKSRGVYVMDGSKRSSHGNAYFTGIGKSKRIVFFDTLIKQLNHEETEAVLAHELGHFKKKHIVKQMIVMFGLTLLVLYIASLLLDKQWLYTSLGVSSITTYNGLILFTFLLGLFSFPFAPLSSFFSRKNEFEADAYASEYADKSDLINGLVKMYRDNASTLTPDPLYVRFYYSHPPASVRIAHLEQISQ